MIPNLPHTRSDFLDRNVDAQKELEHTLENSITLEQEDKQKAILAESATLPTPENLRDLEEKEEIAAFREKLSDTLRKFSVPCLKTKWQMVRSLYWSRWN